MMHLRGSSNLAALAVCVILSIPASAPAGIILTISDSGGAASITTFNPATGDFTATAFDFTNITGNASEQLLPSGGSQITVTYSAQRNGSNNNGMSETLTVSASDTFAGTVSGYNVTNTLSGTSDGSPGTSNVYGSATDLNGTQVLSQSTTITATSAQPRTSFGPTTISGLFNVPPAPYTLETDVLFGTSAGGNLADPVTGISEADPTPAPGSLTLALAGLTALGSGIWVRSRRSPA